MGVTPMITRGGVALVLSPVWPALVVKVPRARRKIEAQHLVAHIKRSHNHSGFTKKSKRTESVVAGAMAQLQLLCAHPCYSALLRWECHHGAVKRHSPMDAKRLYLNCMR